MRERRSREEPPRIPRGLFLCLAAVAGSNGSAALFSSWPVFPFDGKTRSGSRRRAADRLGGATSSSRTYFILLAARIIPFALCLAISALKMQCSVTSFQAWAQPGRITGAAANELWRSLLEYLDDPKAPAVGTRLRLGRDSQNVNSRDAH
ncbi:hypothetical protein HPB50_027040 [Hyalomma asiaticum]|uniref:Uncharacterized protein n=1 Tax=Hyalomma asiaticum TaxID=266040 RepID=A0ACB7RWT2_HYAAI|nr:hypothetical protein HPB50_027040 [Hyalomma asiaticum]